MTPAPQFLSNLMSRNNLTPRLRLRHGTTNQEYPTGSFYSCASPHSSGCCVGNNIGLDVGRHSVSNVTYSGIVSGGRLARGGSLREVRVLLADDYEPWRRCVSSRFLKCPGLRIIGEVSDGLEAVKKAQELKPDLVLLDISLPKLNGVQAAIRIRKAVPMAKIVFMSAYQDSDAVQTVLSNGADGYVLKWEVTRELLPAIEAALGGQKFVTAQVTGQNSPSVKP